MSKKFPFYKLIYPLLALSFVVCFITCQNERINIDTKLASFKDNQNAAIFAAYSEDGTVPEYVVDYLKKLKEIAPNIVYVTDNPVKRSEIKKLAPYITHLTAYRHGEYDWGSYKRGLQTLQKNGPFDKLILANDSTLPLTESFRPVLDKMTAENTDVYGITANLDGAYHLQSYFLILSKNAWQSPAFSGYLNAVQQQKDGLTVAYRYEVPFTRYMEDKGFKSAAYIPYDSLSHLPLNDKNCYPLTLVKDYNAPFLKMRTFTTRLNVQESRRLLFNWLKNHKPHAYKMLLKHLKHINSPYLKDAR